MRPIISVFDRYTRSYHLFVYPQNTGEVGTLVKGNTVAKLNERYELSVDGHIIDWPHTDPHLIEQYIHELIHQGYGRKQVDEHYKNGWRQHIARTRNP